MSEALPGSALPPPDELRAHLARARRSMTVCGIEPADLVPRFYRALFGYAPALRSLFPLSMGVQHSRFGRALVHVLSLLDEPEELVGFLEQLGRDHRKFDVREEHYAVVGRALVESLRESAGEGWTPEIAESWQHTFAFLSDAMRRGARADTGPAWWAAEVVAHRRLDRDTAIVRVRTQTPVGYRAGQYVAVETPTHPRLWRYHSPATAPEGTELEFHVKAVGYGSVSRGIVASAAPGDRWRIGPPMGALDRALVPDRELLMIGGGVGVAPIRAMLEQLERTGGHPRRVVVFYGARDWDALHALDGLRRTTYRNPWLDVVPVVEEEPPVPGPQVGALADVAARFGGWEDCEIVVSGSPAMLAATIRRLRAAGAPPERIHYDPFVVD